jgi:hypothetical protein
MQTTTIRISKAAHDRLKEISQIEDKSMQSVLESILEKYRRESFLRRTNESFKKLQENSANWQEELQERALWDHTLEDDLQDDKSEIG